MTEHTTTYLPMEYSKPKGFNLSGKQSPVAMISKYQDDLQQHMDKMSSKSWELISVEQITKGKPTKATIHGNEFGYSLTDGFFLFWRRRK